MTHYCVESTAATSRHCDGAHVRVKFVPETGRSHQLRVHAAFALGGAIVGEVLYPHATDAVLEEMFASMAGGDVRVPAVPLHLHATRLQFDLPSGRTVSLHEAPFWE